MPGHPSHFNQNERILLFQDGSQLAFEQCYEENIMALCYFTEKIVDDRTVAEDIATECFIKLLDRLQSFENSQKVKSFLFVTANNAALDHLRMKKRHQVSHEEIAYINNRSQEDIERDFIRAEALQAIYQEIDRLPEKSRQVVFMSVIEGLSLDEIAEKLDMAYKTVQHYKTQGLKLLRVALLKNKYLPVGLLPVVLDILSSRYK
ncbi:RNA polymerase sigma factor [Chitinophaga arvensicola]|uniref:RNA polymerase sigma-70 factor, ECF subfamily n=1 Tax=Chitinophaga arvensicola TaxID=29529 RepID=A0A1I0NKE9_9BACT|nr:sigma-70 family RNA polymerase sigma factor [Chitinophaga arvensicola]SEW01931.1 RNA polymerase sigma-70 factor, ECF subfamily [Chitinophaga arvensicola]